MAIEPPSFGVPKPIIDSLPKADGTATQDMQRAVEGLETRLNRTIEDANTESGAAGYVVDALERLEGHYERYDESISELCVWGQSPIYVIARWNLQVDLILQIEEHDWLKPRIDRERNLKLVEDGIRYGK